MKKLLLLTVAMAVVAMPLMSFGAEFRSGDQPSIGKSEKIVNDVYMAGGSVTSMGSVDGDLFAAGGSVLVSGDVKADLFAGGGNINILSDVGDDVRVGGGTVVIEGKVGGDLFVGGGQVTIGGAGIKGDVAIGGGTVRIDAPIGGKLYLGGGTVYINSPITGDVQIEADKLTLGSSAIITGNLTYTATTEMVKEDGAVVNGKVSFAPRVVKTPSPNALAALFPLFLLYKFLTLFICALIVGLTFRKWSKQIVVSATDRALLELGKGVLIMVAMPIVSILLFFTLVGVPFGIFGLLSFAVLMLVSWLVAPIILGSVAYKYIAKKDLEVNWKTILLGVILSSILGLIPLIGWIVQMLLMFITLGAVVELKMKIAKDWR